MIWVVDKKVATHLIERGRLLADVPLRISFEYAVEAGLVVDGSLSIKVLYNSRSVGTRFPDIDEEAFNLEVEQTARDAVREHLAMEGLGAAGKDVESIVIAAH